MIHRPTELVYKDLLLDLVLWCWRCLSAQRQSGRRVLGMAEQEALVPMVGAVSSRSLKMAPGWDGLAGAHAEQARAKAILNESPLARAVRLPLLPLLLLLPLRDRDLLW